MESKHPTEEVQKENKKISKMALDEKKLKAQTIPNPVVTGGMEEIGLERIKPIDIPKYLLMHPAIPRGIELKANRMIKLVDEDLEKNIIPNKSGHKLVKESTDYCKNILDNSGGPLFLKKLSQGAYRFGTGFALLQTDMKDSEVLRFEYQHPIFFGPAFYPKDSFSISWKETPKTERINLSGKMKINPKTKEIEKYTQYTKKYNNNDSKNNLMGSTYVDTRLDEKAKERTGSIELVPFGDEIDQSQVIQLAFDTIGDEPLGISLVQFLHLTVKYLLNMEKGGAQGLVNFGFNKWKANTPFKDIRKMQAFGQTLSNINTDAVVVLPEGITLDNIQPGTTDFDRVHPIYLKLIAMRLGIPMAILTQDGSTTTKASIQEMRKDMYEDFIADELTIERTINSGFFKACKIKYPHLNHKELEAIVPKFKFKQPSEDLDIEMARDLQFSLMIRNFCTGIKDLSQSAEVMPDIGLENTAKVISLKTQQLVNKSMDLDGTKKIEYNGVEK